MPFQLEMAFDDFFVDDLVQGTTRQDSNVESLGRFNFHYRERRRETSRPAEANPINNMDDGSGIAAVA